MHPTTLLRKSRVSSPGNSRKGSTFYDTLVLPADARSFPSARLLRTVLEGGRPGKQCYMIWKSLFEIDKKYVPIKPIGKGAYGVVCSAKDSETGAKVAIKKIANAFDNVTDARRTLREIKLLRRLQHENIVLLRDIMKPPSMDDFNDVYLVYELMDTDLHQIVRSSQGLSDEHSQ